MAGDSLWEMARLRHDLATLQARYDHDVAMLEVELAAAEASQAEQETDTLWAEASFGAFDGMTSVAGIVFALLAKSVSVIVLASVGLAVSSCIGMAAGEYLGDRKAAGALRRSLVMGAATAVGTLVPTIPFFVTANKAAALAAAGVIAVVMATGIGHVRRRGLAGYAATYTILAGAVLATVLVSLAIPASAGG